MGADLPPCERTEYRSWFPRLFLDVLWLRASVIMPRSWLLDGFSTIRAHYSSLGLSCSSLHPLRTCSHTHLYTQNLCRRWTDGRWHMHTNAHRQYTNTNTEAPRSNTTPPPQMAPAERARRPVFGKRRRLGVGAKRRGQQVVRFQVPVGAGRAEVARLCRKHGHQQLLAHGGETHSTLTVLMADDFTSVAWKSILKTREVM